MMRKTRIAEGLQGDWSTLTLASTVCVSYDDGSLEQHLVCYRPFGEGTRVRGQRYRPDPQQLPPTTKRPLGLRQTLTLNGREFPVRSSNTAFDDLPPGGPGSVYRICLPMLTLE